MELYFLSMINCFRKAVCEASWSLLLKEINHIVYRVFCIPTNSSTRVWQGFQEKNELEIFSFLNVLGLSDLMSRVCFSVNVRMREKSLSDLISRYRHTGNIYNFDPVQFDWHFHEVTD